MHQCRLNKLHPPVCLVFQRIEDIGVENKQRQHLLSGPQRMIQAGIIHQPQIPPEPEDDNPEFHVYPYILLLRWTYIAADNRQPKRNPLRSRTHCTPRIALEIKISSA